MYIIKSTSANVILCTDGEMHAANLVGPGGFAPKLYKKRSRAVHVIHGFYGRRKVVELDGKGCEKVEQDK